jgi:sec-independent protein translocase protein TatB
MLDVGFSEILLTSAIALIVLGPERLPKVARQVGNWVGRARAMARHLSEQLEREVSSAEDLAKQAKSSISNLSATSNSAAAPTTSAPSAFDTAYTPNIPQPAVAPPSPIELPATTPPPGAYSPETASTVHGADWHASPSENKTAND